MDSERLQTLKRQKRILQEHLDWINEEIDRETVSAPSTSPKTSRLVEAIAAEKEIASSLEIESSPPGAVVSDLYAELGPDTKRAAADTKRGCLIVGGLAFAALAAVTAWVVSYY